MEITAFILVAVAVIIIPGPNVLVIISTSLSQGKTRGLQTVAGTGSAMLIQLVVAALGTGLVVSAITRGLYWLKWCGVAYLLYLGIRCLLSLRDNTGTRTSSTGSFLQGFWVSLTNPKTILFFSALLPQFVSPGHPYGQQIFILSALFWFIAIVLDSAYALLAAQCRLLLESDNSVKYQKGLSGLVYIGASALLAGISTENYRK